MSAVPDVMHQLGVLCITYNRAETWGGRSTSSQQGHWRIVASRSSTTLRAIAPPEVCAEKGRSSPISARSATTKDIGASANYLRAVELVTTPYTWIICDDDAYDFGRFGDVLEALVSKKFDLVSLGSAAGYGWARGVATTTLDLRHAHPGFHFASSFVPSLIFRTNLFDSKALTEGYRMAGSLFPHFPFLTVCATEPRSIYVAREQVLFRNSDQNVLSPLHFLTSWVENCSTIEEAGLRRQVVYEAFGLGQGGHRWRFVINVAQWIAFERLTHPERAVRELATIALGLSGDQRLLFSMLAPLGLLPRGLYGALRRRRHRAAGTAPTGFAEERDRLRL